MTDTTCPIEAVFGGGAALRYPCTYARGHDGPHSFKERMNPPSEYDLRSVAEARKLAAVSGVEAVRALTGDDDNEMAYSVFIGRLQHHLRDLLAIIDREIGGER